MTAADLGWAGIAELAPRLRSRALSPVALCRHLLDRCERLAHLNAFITLSPERILEEAAASEAALAAGRARGPLEGIPVAVKDLCHTRGERTTGGFRIHADRVSDHDATVVARLRSAGAIVFGKTNTPEMAYGPLDEYHYGPSRNPWDPDRFTGGSSMGAAAALAAGLAPGALGSDTGGSIRGPAHWSGVTGLKPTWGRVPLRGVVALASSLDHVGPMARSAEDAALLLAVLAGHDPEDLTSADVAVPDYARELAGPVRGLRAGVLRFLWEGLPEPIAAGVNEALAHLARMGVELADVEVPEWFAAADANALLIRCEAAAEYREILVTRAGDLIPAVRERLETGLATPAPDYVDALRTGRRLRDQLGRVFRRHDLLLLPGRDQTAPRMEPSGRLLEPLSSRNYMAPANLAGVPALTVPCGFGPGGLPIGIQLVGPWWSEGRLLAVAHAFQGQTDWHRRRAPVD